MVVDFVVVGRSDDFRTVSRPTILGRSPSENPELDEGLELDTDTVIGGGHLRRTRELRRTRGVRRSCPHLDLFFCFNKNKLCVAIRLPPGRTGNTFQH